jgi:hypothetical protein
VDRVYFTWLAEMFEGMTDEEWTDLKGRVFLEEVPLGSLYRGFCYEQSEAGKAHRRNNPIYAAMSKTGVARGLLFNASKTMRNGFALWSAIPTEAKLAVEKDWAELLQSAPQELIRIAMKAGKGL